MQKRKIMKMLAIAMAFGIAGTQNGVAFAAEAAGNESEKAAVSEQSADQLEEETENETDEIYQLTHPWREGHKEEYEEYIKQNELPPEELQRLIDAGLAQVDLPADDTPSEELLQAPKNVKVYKKTSTAATVKWSPVKDADGYRIILVRDELYCWYDGVKEGGKTASCTLKDLDESETYEIQVVAYKKEDGKRIFGNPSKKIKLDMKKQLAPTEISVAKRLALVPNSKRKLEVTVKKGANRAYIKSVQYKVKNAKICTVKKGVISAKKLGTTTVQTTVTLKNGLKKAFQTKVMVRNNVWTLEGDKTI